MTYLALLAMCIAFVELFIRTGIAAHATTTLHLARQSLTVLRSRSLSDEQKEHLVRRNALGLLRATASISLRLLLVAAVLGALFVAAVELLAVPEHELVTGMLSPVGAVVLTLAALLYLRIRHVLHQRL